MLSNILNAYRFRSRIDRIELFIGVFVVIIIFGIATYLVRFVLLPLPISNIVVFNFVNQILATIFIIPLVAGRLRDLGWSPIISSLLFVPFAFDPKLYILLASEVDDAGLMPSWTLLLGPPAFFVYLFFYLTLFLWKGDRADAA